ncbi:hypothetical protein PC128_g25502 [Phytophthora cactorum]|nr:hypothetical protein PC128_g25502 [Phytophthora cactorum]
MDVRVAEDDTLLSLEEALAFIDGCDINVLSETETLVHCSPVDLFSQITPSELIAHIAPTTTKKRIKLQRKLSESSSRQDEKAIKKRRTKSVTNYSTRLQQRKRADIQRLREQAHELEAQVALLKTSRFLPGDVVLELDSESLRGGGGLVGQEKQPASWHEMAIAQYRERLVSEKMNRRLKSILVYQKEANRALSGLLQKRSVLSGMDYVFSAQSDMETASLFAKDSADVGPSKVNKKINSELEEVVRRMYKEVNAQSKENKPTTAISCDMRIKHDARRGKMVELVTTTPMSCSVEDATEIVWKELTTSRDYPDKVYKYMRNGKPNSQEISFVLTLRSPSGILELNGVQYMEKYEEVDRTIVAVAERIVLSTKNLQYRDECWMTVKRSASDTKVSIVEVFHQLYMEQDDGLVVCPDDLAYGQDIVMGSMGNTLRKLLLAQQNTLMEKAGRIICS